MSPLKYLLKLFGVTLAWGTVSAYLFNMLKKPESSATADKGGPAASGLAPGETSSKQVYWDGFLRAAALY